MARDVFFEKGFGSSTVDDIVAKAKVARGTFYLYFPNKRAIFEALVDDFLGRIAEAIHTIDTSEEAPPARAQLRANIVRLVELALRELTTGDTPYAEIALRLGYSEQSSFCRAFRAWTGVTPGEYRRQHSRRLH